MKALVTTVLLTGAALAAAEPAGAVPAAGRTLQHAGRYGAQRLPSNAVSFTFARGKVSRFSIPWVAPCTNTDVKGAQPPLLDRMVITDGLPVRRGRFTATGEYAFPPGTSQSATVKFTLSGTVRGGRASGTLAVGATLAVSSQGLVGGCGTSKPIRWHAVVGRRARAAAAPVRNRPVPLLVGLLAYARSDDGGATSALWSIVPGGVQRPVQLTHPTGGATDSSPSMPVHPFMMTYQRIANGVSQLYITDPEGFGLTYGTPLGDGRITDFPQGAGDPAVIDGVVVASVGTGADCSLWATNQNGEKQVQLTDHGGAPGCDDAPAWSPDGERLVFRRTVTDAAGTPQSVRWLLLSMLGGAAQPLDFGSVVPSAVSWAPGPKLAYVRPGGLAVMNADGSGRRTVLSAAGVTGRPAWSPLGNAIAVPMRRADGSTDLVAVPAAGGAPTDVTDTPGQSESDPDWVYQPPRAGGGAPGPSVHVHSQSARPHGRRKKRT